MAPAKKTNEKNLYRNPFLNFLREFRQKNSSLHATEIVSKGARIWNKFTLKEKSKYRPNSPRVTKGKGRKGKKSKSRSKRRKQSRKSSKSKSRSPSKTRKEETRPKKEENQN